MKKPKIKLDVAAIKAMAIEHGEKALFALAVLLLLWMGWGALQRESLPPTMSKDNLVAQANQTETHVGNSKFAGDIQPVNLRFHGAEIGRDSYPLAPFDPPLHDSQRRRGAVALLPIEELQSAAGYDTFITRDKEDRAAPADSPRKPSGIGGRNAGTNSGRGLGGGSLDDDEVGRARVGSSVANGAKLDSTAWAVVTGLVPVKKQLAEYDKAFASAQHFSAEADVPVYYKPEIERAEVTSDNMDSLTWAPIDTKAVMKAEKLFAAGNDICDPEYFDKNLTRPVPALFGQSWDERVLHRKLKAVRPGTAARQPAQASSDPDDIGANPDDDGAAAPAVKPADDDDWGSAAREAEQPARRPKAGAAASGGKVQGLNAPQHGAQASNRPTLNKPYKLFRVFDYTVQSGKKYRYRVRWLVLNPNHNVEERYLANPELAKEEFLPTDWSEPSPVVRIPYGFGVIAGPAVKPNDGNTRANPKAKIQLTTFHDESGLLVATDLEVMRGSLANKLEKKLETTDATGNKRSLENVGFSTDAVVLDIRGGQSVIKVDVRGDQAAFKKDQSLFEPTEVLVLDREGNLVVRNELDDADAYASHTQAETKKSGEPARAASKGASDDGENLLGHDSGKKPRNSKQKPAEGAGRTPRGFGAKGHD